MSSDPAQLAADACAAMAAALAILREGGNNTSRPPPTPSHVAGAVQLLRMEASKVGLLYNQAVPPTRSEAAALLAGTTNVVGGLCLLLGGAMTDAGPTLSAALSAAAGGMVGAVSALVRGAAAQGARGPALMQLAGACLEQADALPRVPLNNKTAIGRALTKVLKQLADGSRELREVAPPEGEGPGGAAVGAEGSANGTHPGGKLEANGGGSEGGGGEEPLEAEAGQEEDAMEEEEVEEGGVEVLEGGELQTARAVAALLAAAAAVVRGAARRLLAAASVAGPAVEAWESVAFHTHALAAAVDELAAAAMYPPHDCEELGGAAEAVATSCELIALESPAPAGGEGAGDALAAALTTAQAAHAALRSRLAAAEAESGAGA